MPFTLTLPKDYPWVALAASSTWFLLAGQVQNVNNARKAAGIQYPQLYAEKAEMAHSTAAMRFNCAQRAHHNTLESLPLVLFSDTLLTGVYYPITAASLCTAWVLGKALFTYAYMTGDPKKERSFNSYGAIVGPVAMLGLGLGSVVTSIQMILRARK